MSLIISSFKQSLRAAPAVLKETTLYFGLYFFAGSLIVLALFKNSASSDGFFSFYDSFSFATILNSGLLFFASLFTVFIVPYYAFKYSQGSAPKFWDFIKNNIWLLVFTHIKAFFIILFFLLLLILPGIYKSIRWSFLNETVFFDKQNQKSILKQADANTRGWFWKIVLFFILYGLLSFILNWTLKAGLSDSHLATSWLKLIALFYLKCFYLLWKTHLFFEIKKQKGEPISC